MAQREVVPNIPEPDYDDPKELYALFGFAAYCASLLEMSLVNLLAAVRISAPGDVPAIHGDQVFDDLDKRTFGQLLSEARKVVAIDAATIELLETSRQRRNFLMHSFFRSHAETQLHPRGRARMIDELHDMAVLFRKADDVADPLYRAAWRKLGITDAMYEAELARMREESAQRRNV